MGRENRIWAVALAAAFLLCLASAFLLWRAPGRRTVARVSVDGAVVREIDLTAECTIFKCTVTNTDQVI